MSGGLGVLAPEFHNRSRRTVTTTGSGMAKKILVVDDQEDVRTLLTQSLVAKGYQVSSACNGAECWQAVRSARPDVLILDIEMPVMNGIEVLQKIREHPELKDLPVIMLTGKSEDQDILAGYSFGADFYITKPFNMRMVLTGIERMLAEDKP